MRIPTTMDDNSASQHNGGGGGAGAAGVTHWDSDGLCGPRKSDERGVRKSDEPSNTLVYSVPGILHFIQHEWARFELERAQWQVDRAEYEAQIAFLKGERKGQDNLKNDLVRRIKMLEYALKQERAKLHKLKYGVEMQLGELRPPLEEPPKDAEPAEKTQWKQSDCCQGRQLIKQYLQEIGYTDTILDVRSNRVRSLLGLNNNDDQDEVAASLNGNQRFKHNVSTTRKMASGWCTDEGMSTQDAAAVFTQFEFLGQEMDKDDTDDVDKPNNEEVDHEAEEMLNELNMITESEAEKGGQGDEYPVVKLGSSVGGVRETARVCEADETPLALGELAQLTVSNEPESYEGTAGKDSFRKTWNAKYTLRSHFDGVRALAFHPTEAALVTASEDHTLKLWNLQRTIPTKKTAGLDVEPLYTFRAHTGPVLCLAMGAPRSEEFFSGSADSTICVWNLPPATADPYDDYDPYMLGATLTDHNDAVWSLSWAHGKLLSSSADGTVRLWSPRAPRPLLSTLRSELAADGVPACADLAAGATRAAVAYRGGAIVTYDLETGSVALRVECESPASRVRAHPTLPVTVTAHEDRHIRFWDDATGRLAHSMVAHLDAVTGLALDPNGLFLLSGSHDCSMRLWNLDTKTCVQEITAHRKKFDESILDVAFHPLRPYIASAGADGLAKVFV